MKKMKKTLLMMVLAMMTPLLLLQVSCAGVKEGRTQDAAAIQASDETEDVEEASDEDMLLADKHEAAGISCSDCHEEDPPANKVSQPTCLTCHEDYQELAASYLDPHNAHQSYSDCGDCHHIHRTSEQICQGCHHTFNIQAP
jgi:fumarate reductase flavoprotein subunit